MKVDRLLYAGNNLKTAQEMFVNAIKHRPRIRLAIRRRDARALSVARGMTPQKAESSI